ncbi:hypothetical protein K2173_002593 [Erythroxylum novogranatense]|uniref:Uncharacterized protein n=1 Tax=Erythroxylum novogranatense TaxID=1862640 RepID=A0AAV8TTI0_9ROSI|nr:hypothetical protein K2173_002593 [Erythroxylum novogranatense]
MAVKKPSKHTNLRKFVNAPIKILVMARNLYVKGMNECSQHLGAASFGCPTGHLNDLSRSSSLSSSKSGNRDDDYRELVKAAVSNTLKRQQSRKSARKVGRTLSVGFPIIDEEKSCHFEYVKVNVDIFARSRSSPVPKRTIGPLKLGEIENKDSFVS